MVDGKNALGSQGFEYWLSLCGNVVAIGARNDGMLGSRSHYVFSKIKSD
jgi:hypothetical protein